MSSEFLEKIRNIIISLLVLFISILNTWIAFCFLPVHAAESTSFLLVSNAGEFTSKLQTDYNQEVFTYVGKCSDKNYFYALAFNGDTASDNRKRFLFYKYQIGSAESPVRSSYDSPIDVVAYGVRENGESYSRITMTGYSGYDGFLLYCDNDGKYINFESTLPIFDSFDSLKRYCLTGDTSGLLNGGSVDNPDFEDTAYAFTGFTANNKMTATWTGTTERTYLQDQEVDEYVRVNYYFADKEAQDTIKQADAYPDEFATADKTLTIDVSGLKPDNENWFLRYIRITPCYRQAGSGAWGDFYHGSDVYVYFDVKGNIEKVIQKSKPTDLNKGNMVYDSSIGYLQNVIYTEQKTHDGSGRQATFKWSTLKSLPDDAQIEIVAQNFYIEWFNKKTEENFIYKEYGEDCFYSAGSYSFNANTPVWTWLKEKEIDPFSIKTQSYGSTEYYLRIVVYNVSDSLYHYGGWVKVNIKSKDTTIMPSTDVETGGFDDSSGLWNQDTASSDSYHYSTDDKGKLTGNIDVNSWEDLNMNSFTWMYRNMQSMVSSLGEFPAMVNAVFGYLPVQYITSIGVLLVAIVFLRFLGR